MRSPLNRGGLTGFKTSHLPAIILVESGSEGERERESRGEERELDWGVGEGRDLYGDCAILSAYSVEKGDSE
jgi:hypothetical protein